MLLSSSTILLALTSILSSTVYASPDAPATPTPTLPTPIQALVDQVDRVALHAALHESHPSFTDGTHENDIAAIHEIHRGNPRLATHILELARRQNSNATTSNAASAHQTTEVYLSTYTAPDGQRSTITAVTVIGVDATADAGGATATSASSGSGSGSSGTLQNGANRGISNPSEHFTLPYQATALVLFLGWLGLA